MGSREHRITSSRDSQTGSDVITQTASGAPLHLFLVLHAPVLKPDLDLSLGEDEPLRQFKADRFRDVHVGDVDALELGQLLFRVRATLLAWWSGRRRRLKRPWVSNQLSYTTTTRRRSLGRRPRQRGSRWNVV